MPVWSGSGEGSLPGLYTATFSLCPCVVEERVVVRKWGREISGASFKGTNPIRPQPCPPDLITSQRPQIPPHWSLGLQHMNLGGVGDMNIQSLTSCQQLHYNDVTTPKGQSRRQWLRELNRLAQSLQEVHGRIKIQTQVGAPPLPQS